MDETILTGALYDIFYYSAIFIMPPLILGTLVAFLIGLFQAVTQIQEQTLPQTIKILVIGFVLILFGGVLTAPLYATSDRLFSTFHIQNR